MVYKYTSIKRVIAKVLTDLDLQEQSTRTTDMVEWAGEAMLKIGAFPQFNIRTTGREELPLLELTNYQVELPYDFHSLIQVSYCSSSGGPFYPMRQSTGSFDYNPVTTEVSTNDIEVSTNSIVALAMQLYSLTYEEALEKINTEPSTRSFLNSILGSDNTVSTTDSSTFDYVYVIRGGYIKTNMETGYLMVVYQAIPTDIEGYPLIPDDESFIEALYWYIVMKLYYPQWVSGKIRDGVYFEARRSWNYYCKQAYGAALMPDRGQLESIKNSWLRLLPNINEADTDYVNLGEQQIVYTHST